MRFTKEFKLECVRKHKAGEHIDCPGGCKRHTFMDSVRKWVAIYNALGEIGLEHKKPKRDWKAKLGMIQRVEEGESFRSVALSNGIQADLLLKWHKIYTERGIDGLKSSGKRGRPPKMRSKPKPPSGPKTVDELERENEELRAENEYLKKLSALVRGRKGRQPRKK